MPDSERFARMARQGVAYPMVDDVRVADPKTLMGVPRDGETVGEIMVRSNTVMKGYLKNSGATAKTLVNGWCLSGDLAVWHPDGAIEIKDRSKDIIISGGENISSLEVEEVLTQHPSVMLAAVVARPDPKWGETPCAFVELKPGASRPDDAEVFAFCKSRLARFKVPKTLVFGPLPKTSTGKIQKFLLREQVKSLETKS
jgi:fatty-acyl-CoA synthase